MELKPLKTILVGGGHRSLTYANLANVESDKMEITVQGNEERILLLARYNNLGKGASGAAVECMNIVMQQDPGTGLDL